MRLAALAAAWILTLAATAPVAWAADAGTPQACDPTAELEAAKRAAAAGDQASAVEHLLRADAILAACERDPANAGPARERERPERALSRGSGRHSSLSCG